MVALYCALALASLFFGIGVVLLGCAAIVGGLAYLREVNTRATHDEALARQWAARDQRRAQEKQQRESILSAVVPIAAAALAGAVGFLFRRDEPKGCTAPVHPWPPASDWSPFGDDDDKDTNVEVDIAPLLEAIAEAGFGEWLIDTMRFAKERRDEASAAADPAPTMV